MSISQKDNGAAALIGRLGRGSAVDVGVLGRRASETHTNTFTTVAQIAAWAEFGIGQPRRSWLIDWIEQNLVEIQNVQRHEFQAVFTGTRTQAQAQARVGVWIVGEIKARIAQGISPPNAPSTIAQKGSSTPLIDTGQLRSAIDSRVVE